MNNIAYVLMSENDDIFGICFDKETAFKKSCEIAIDYLLYNDKINESDSRFLEINELFEEKDYRKCFYKLKDHGFSSACPIIKETRIFKDE